MSKLAEFKALEAKLAEQLAQLDALKNDKELKLEIEFEQKLRALLNEYDYSLRNVIAILDQEALPSTAPQKSTGQRRARAVKIYIHPKTNERVETKGGNHAVLKAWKVEHGAETVETWLQ